MEQQDKITGHYLIQSSLEWFCKPGSRLENVSFSWSGSSQFLLTISASQKSKTPEEVTLNR